MPSRRSRRAQAVVVRERPVVDEADVLARRERMRAGGRHPALGRHPRVAEAVGALEVLEGEALGELARPPSLLVDLDRPARAHDAKLGVPFANPGLGLSRLRLHGQDGVGGANRGLGGGAEDRLELGGERLPILEGVRRVQGQLARARRRRITVDGDAGAVGPAVVHLDEHRRRAGVRASPRSQATWRRARRSRTYVLKVHRSHGTNLCVLNGLPACCMWRPNISAGLGWLRHPKPARRPRRSGARRPCWSCGPSRRSSTGRGPSHGQSSSEPPARRRRDRGCRPRWSRG